MKLVVIGAGAIGGVVGGRLAAAGHEVTLVARGAHGAAIRERGLRLESPAGVDLLKIPAVEKIADAPWAPGTVALSCVKTTDAAAALRDLAIAAPPETPVACFTNGLDAERQASRWFGSVYGVHVVCPATHLEPGVVLAWGDGVPGILDLGRAPEGTDETATALAAALVGAGFRSEARADILRWKRTKLLANLGNAVEALVGPGARDSTLAERLRAEGIACYRAANLPFASKEEDAQLRPGYRSGTIAGREHPGGSTWQSLARGAHTLESEFLNGEICLLGRLHGVPTPLNAALLREATRAAAAGASPGAMSVADLEQRLTR